MLNAPTNSQNITAIIRTTLTNEIAKHNPALIFNPDLFELNQFNSAAAKELAIVWYLLNMIDKNTYENVICLGGLRYDEVDHQGPLDNIYRSLSEHTIQAANFRTCILNLSHEALWNSTLPPKNENHIQALMFQIAKYSPALFVFLSEQRPDLLNSANMFEVNYFQVSPLNYFVLPRSHPSTQTIQSNFLVNLINQLPVIDKLTKGNDSTSFEPSVLIRLYQLFLRGGMEAPFKTVILKFGHLLSTACFESSFNHFSFLYEALLLASSDPSNQQIQDKIKLLLGYIPGILSNRQLNYYDYKLKSLNILLSDLGEFGTQIKALIKARNELFTCMNELEIELSSDMLAKLNTLAKKAFRLGFIKAFSSVAPYLSRTGLLTDLELAQYVDETSLDNRHIEVLIADRCVETALSKHSFENKAEHYQIALDFAYQLPEELAIVALRKIAHAVRFNSLGSDETLSMVFLHTQYTAKQSYHFINTLLDLDNRTRYHVANLQSSETITAPPTLPKHQLTAAQFETYLNELVETFHKHKLSARIPLSDQLIKAIQAICHDPESQYHGTSILCVALERAFSDQVIWNLPFNSETLLIKSNNPSHQGATALWLLARNYRRVFKDVFRNLSELIPGSELRHCPIGKFGPLPSIFDMLFTDEDTFSDIESWQAFIDKLLPEEIIKYELFRKFLQQGEGSTLHLFILLLIEHAHKFNIQYFETKQNNWRKSYKNSNTYSIMDALFELYTSSKLMTSILSGSLKLKGTFDVYRLCIELILTQTDGIISASLMRDIPDRIEWLTLIKARNEFLNCLDKINAATLSNQAVNYPELAKLDRLAREAYAAGYAKALQLAARVFAQCQFLEPEQVRHYVGDGNDDPHDEAIDLLKALRFHSSQRSNTYPDTLTVIKPSALMLTHAEALQVNQTALEHLFAKASQQDDKREWYLEQALAFVLELAPENRLINLIRVGGSYVGLNLNDIAQRQQFTTACEHERIFGLLQASHYRAILGQLRYFKRYQRFYLTPIATVMPPEPVQPEPVQPESVDDDNDREENKVYLVNRKRKAPRSLTEARRGSEDSEDSDADSSSDFPRLDRGNHKRSRQT